MSRRPEGFVKHLVTIEECQSENTSTQQGKKNLSFYGVDVNFVFTQIASLVK
jgi:hypothetical protein